MTNKRIGKKILRILLITMLLLPIIILALVTIICASSPVQTFLTSKISENFSKKFGTEISVSKVFINPFTRTVNLENIYLEDLNHDTILFAKNLEAKLKSFELYQNYYHLSKVVLQNATANMITDSNGVFNYQFLIPQKDSLNVDTLKSDTKFKIVIDRIKIENINYRLTTKESKYKKPEIDFNDLRLRNIYLYAKNFSINEKIEISTKIDSLKAYEHCGFNLKKLTSKTYVSTQKIKLTDLNLVTNKTNLFADSLNFYYADFGSFSDFCNQVEIGAKINEGSNLDVDDIGRFAPVLYGFGINPKVSVEVKGPVNNLKIKDLKLGYQNDTKLIADADIKGLPEISDTYFNINIKDLIATQTDINTLHKQNTDTPLVQLPDAIKELGAIDFKAKINGKTDDLNINGNLLSNLGNINTNVKIKSNELETQIEGLIGANKLDLGSVTGDSQSFGYLSTNDTINISILNNGQITGLIKGAVDSLGLLGYTYSKINMNGVFSNTNFDGKISIKDPNLDFDFNGLVNYSNEETKANFKLKVAKADLKQINLMQDSIDNLNFALIADIEGNDIDNLNGIIKLTEKLIFKKNNKTLIVNNFSINAFIDHYICSLPHRKLKLRSDYIDADIEGLFATNQLAKIMSNFSYMVFPSLKYTDEEAVAQIKNRLAQMPTKKQANAFKDPDFKKNLGNNFKFNTTLKNPEKITSLFIPEITISNNTKIEGGFNTRQSHIWIDLKTDKLGYNEIMADSLNISAHAIKKDLILNIKADSVEVSQDMKIKNPNIIVKAQNDNANFNIAWNNTDSIKNEGEIKGNINITKHYLQNHFPLILASLDQSSFYLMNSKWDINKSDIKIDSTSIEINKFGLVSDKQLIEANGKISENSTEKINANIENFNLEFIKKLTGINISGILNGNTDISNIYSSIPLFVTSNKIENLIINDVGLGDLLAEFNFTPKDSIVNIDFYTKRRLQIKSAQERDTIKPIHGYGCCNITKKEIDFKLDITSLPFNTFKPIYENYIKSSNYTNLSGYARVKGKIEDPKIMAQLSIHGGNFKIMSLGTQYDINDSLGITLDNNIIKISKTTLYSDKKSGNAILEGTISHKNFDNINMNLSLAVKNFMFLNAKQTDTSLFYGKAYASGEIFLTGNPMRMININGRVKTEKNTLVYLPMTGASDVNTDNEFITFKTNDTLLIVEKRHGADLSGLQMNFNLEVTPEAEVQVILDETTGNILKASANGDLRLNISNTGDFNMYGTLAVEKGEYLFTMQNVLSKKFEVEKGGTLRWNGNPMDAIVNISAMYKLRKVNLYNLMVDEDYRDKKVPVSCLLNMQGDLNEPTISFGVKLEGNYDDVQTQLSNLDEGNINKQVISLLLLSQFQPLPGLQNAENSLFSDINPGELVSNQINHWLSDISDKVDVGVNYSLGDNATNSELEVALSTQLFDDRVTISTNVGVGGDSKTTTSTRANNVVGEVEVDVNLNKTGTVKLKVYNKANEDELDQAPYTQGVGVSFKKEFNNRHDLFSRKKKRKLIKLEE
ncbi:MAG: translocation/assembly module TamB domain-containing protein [Bacteroidales bacterium]|nr:translocation/assembly module TamB domain-containing protein [Bacteroidales bacterium]